MNNALLGIYLDDKAEFEIFYNIFLNHKHSALDICSENIKGKFFNNTIDKADYGIIYGNTLYTELQIEVFNNIFQNCTNAISCTKIFATMLENNLFYNNEKNFWDWAKKENVALSSTNILSDPQFIDTEDYNYGLQSTSPCIRAGINSADIGAVRYVPDRTNITLTKLAGIATNVSVNKSSGIKIEISKIDDENYLMKGSFDNINLFGNFELNGKILPNANGEGVICMQFTGMAYLGENDGSGFPPNTKASFVITLSLTAGGAKGTYHIGKISSHIDYEQYGILELFYEL